METTIPLTLSDAKRLIETLQAEITKAENCKTTIKLLFKSLLHRFA